MSYLFVLDCCELIDAFENKRGNPITLLQTSKVGQMINLVRKNTTLNDEPIHLGVTHHVLDTSAYKLEVKKLHSHKKEDFLRFLIATFNRLSELGLVEYDQVHENYQQITEMCGDGYCDFDTEDGAVLEGAKRFRRRGYKVVVVTEDTGLHGYANDENFQAVRMNDALAMLTAASLVAA